MENFIVSARKYRPTTFDSVVGQESITQTLRNAISNNHLAQALLFCGPRGVGKTTCARILAKAINLSDRDAGDVALTDENEDFSFNIFELDAASNNSVEDIRNLIDQVRFPPQVGKFKVYIIDEVHMLSQAAFNAFLKTLEEPPKHAIFILATTEKHKIIPTILSRCQVFDFNRIQIDDIASHLAKIAEKEGVSAEIDALHVIAEKADGALRDALSMFDQIVSYSGNQLTYKAAIDNLNILDHDYYFRISEAIVQGDIPNALLTFDEILQHGFDGHNFIVGLEQHLRNLLVSRDESMLNLIEVGGNIREKYKEQNTKFNTALLLSALDKCNSCDIAYKNSKNQRLLVELTLMQLCSLSGNVANGETSEAKKKTSQLIPPAQVSNTGSVPSASAGTTKTNEPVEQPQIQVQEQDAHKEPVSDVVTNIHQEAPPTVEKSEVNVESNPNENQDSAWQKNQPKAPSVPEPVEPALEIPMEPIQADQSDEDGGDQPLPAPAVIPDVPVEKMEAELAETGVQTQMKEQEVSSSPGLNIQNNLPGKPKNTVRISNFVQEKEEEQEVEQHHDENRPADHFNQEDLLKLWKVLAERADGKGHYTLMSILNKEPILKENFEIELRLDNSAQEEEFNIQKSSIQEELRTKLNNFKLHFVVNIETKEENNKAYTAAEKFNKMAEKNPHLNTLKDQLGLDINR